MESLLADINVSYVVMLILLAESIFNALNITRRKVFYTFVMGVGLGIAFFIYDNPGEPLKYGIKLLVSYTFATSAYEMLVKQIKNSSSLGINSSNSPIK